MRISDKDLQSWVLENPIGIFPTRLPGMSEGRHWIFRMFYYLAIECSSKAPKINVRHLYGDPKRFQADVSAVVSYIQAGKYYSLECALAYINWKRFSPVYSFADLEPFQHVSGYCRQVINDKQEQGRLF